jgi:hypothetical protein
MPRPLFLLPLLAAPLLVRAPQVLAAPASTSTASAPVKLTFLDDDAEAGGFDITASVQSLPVQWNLCQDDEGQAYVLKLSSSGASLASVAITSLPEPARAAISRRIRRSPSLSSRPPTAMIVPGFGRLRCFGAVFLSFAATK